MYNPKTCSHEGVSPARGNKKRRCAEQHQAQAHNGDNAHGKRSAGDDGRSVEQEPNSREGSERFSLKKSVGQKSAHNNGRSEERRVGKECRSRWWTDQ